MHNLSKIAAAAAALLASSYAAAQPAKVTIGYATASDFMAVFVAKEKGFFAKNNIDAEVTRIPIVTNVPPALMSGSLQVGAATLPGFLQSLDGGLDMMLVGGAARHLRALPTISLVARKDVKIEKPSDLEGKKIGVSGLNNIMDMFLRKWMRDAGADDKKMILIEVQIPQIPDMIRNGTLDAASAVEPIRSAVVGSGAGYIAAEYFGEVNPDALVSGWIATGDYVRKNPDVIKGFRAAADEALAYINTGAPDLKDIEKKYLGFNSPRWPKFSNAAAAADLQVFLDIGKQLGTYKTAIDPAKAVWK